MANHHEIQAAIKVERLYQDSKWGPIEQHPHDVGGWLTIIRRELFEAEEAWCSSASDDAALCEILQIAAVAFACMEQHGVVPRKSMNVGEEQTDGDLR